MTLVAESTAQKKKVVDINFSDKDRYFSRKKELNGFGVVKT